MINDQPSYMGKWIPLIEEFHHELAKLGIKEPVDVLMKDHHETFEIRLEYPEGISPDERINALAQKYEKIINSTCTTCGGKKAEHCDYLCDACSLEWMKERDYEVTDKGFSYFSWQSHPYQKRFCSWEDLKLARFRFTDKEDDTWITPWDMEIEFTLNKKEVVFNNDIDTGYDTCSCTNRYENFYALLRAIPADKLNEPNRAFQHSMKHELGPCNICGRVAVYEQKVCLVCEKSFYTKLPERLKNQYKTIEERLKEEQLYFYWMDEDRYKYPRREKEFEKVPDHLILFSPEEMNHYRNKWLEVED